VAVNLNTPVLLLIIRRPDLTARVFERIREARPPRLYVAADGPREGRRSERSDAEATRRLVLDGIDWDCEVRTLFRDENLGVRRAVDSAITWFFENEEQGIILEDDCLADRCFFDYCEQLLDRYRDDERVMHIGGNCFLRAPDLEASYFFSTYPHIWGWATWRDAWAHFSPTSPDFEAEFEQIQPAFSTPEQAAYWHDTLSRYLGGEFDTWDYGWAFSIWRAGGLATYPAANLVRNLGFGAAAANTKAWKDYKGLGRLPLQSIDEIRHPESVTRNPALDAENFEVVYDRPPLPRRALAVARAALSRTRL
jgi:hypothetical protein